MKQQQQLSTHAVVDSPSELVKKKHIKTIMKTKKKSFSREIFLKAIFGDRRTAKKKNLRKLFFPQRARVMTSLNVHKNIFLDWCVLGCFIVFFFCFVVAYYFERREENNKNVSFLISRKRRLIVSLTFHRVTIMSG